MLVVSAFRFELTLATATEDISRLQGTCFIHEGIYVVDKKRKYGRKGFCKCHLAKYLEHRGRHFLIVLMSIAPILRLTAAYIMNSTALPLIE